MSKKVLKIPYKVKDKQGVEWRLLSNVEIIREGDKLGKRNCTAGIDAAISCGFSWHLNLPVWKANKFSLSCNLGLWNFYRKITYV